MQLCLRAGICFDLFSIFSVSSTSAVGPVRAGELVLRSIDSVATLRKRITTDSTLLDRQQTIGLRHYEDLLQRIPRSEVAKIEEYVRRIVEECMPHEAIKVEVAGSYLRGAQTCGDVDVMLVGVRDVVSKGLETIVRRMCEAGTVTDALMLSSNKFFGVFRLGPGMAHRRLDLFAVPSEEYAFALLTYTGSGQFNRSMRCLAGRMGYTLSHKGLHHAKKTKTGHIKCGPSISCDTEQEIFEHLGMQYVMPTARGKSS